MALTAAERQKRLRAHKKGDHSLCDPARQCDVTASVTPPVTRPPAGPRLQAAGRRLWDELDGDQAAGGARALILEACRITDRLAALDRIIGADAADWLEIVESKGDPERQQLVINAPLAEARQQATALKQLLAELRQSSAAKPAEPKPTGEGAGIVNLTAAIAKRRNQTAG